MLSIVTLALAIACPPLVEDAVVVRQEGDKCGGMCDTFGKCADGLECVVEKPKTSSLSFAILTGVPALPGVCVGKVEKRQLGFGMAGGAHPVDVASEEVVGAAKQAMAMVLRASNSLTPPQLSKIVSAQKQVVSGIKYIIELEMTDNSHHRVELIDQAWMTPRFTLVSHEVL